jgi:hypothetical protein
MKRVKCYLLSPGDNYNGPRYSNDKRYNSFNIEVTLRDGITMMFKDGEMMDMVFHSKKRK